MRIEKSKGIEGKEITKKHKSNELQDITNWVNKRSGSWNISIAPRELQSISKNTPLGKKESIVQEINIRNNS